MSNTKLYADRDIIEQGDHYAAHVLHMTSEGLHDKSDIAAELAHRDIEIEKLKARLDSIAPHLYDITTDKGTQPVPGFVLPDCPGLAITLADAGRFTITHLATGMRVSAGNYERFDNALVDLIRLTLIARTYNFCWSDADAKESISSLKTEPVPFDECTVHDKDGVRPMAAFHWVRSLTPYMPFRDIDSPPWEERHPGDQAEELLNDLLALGQQPPVTKGEEETNGM